MREIKTHEVEGAPNTVKIVVLDQPGAGGACHMYAMDVVQPRGTPQTDEPDPRMRQRVTFQTGPINEVGANGVTQEALLAIVIDRLESFHLGLFPSDENQLALEKAREALHWLQIRTVRRIVRGVEGQTKA